MGEFYVLELTEEFIRELRETLLDMKGSVELELFLGPNCETCDDTYKLVKTIAEASPNTGNEHLIRLSVYDSGNPEHGKVFRERGVDRIPALLMLKGQIRYLGIPAGEEIRALVETIIRVSENESGLEETTKKELSRIKDRRVVIETIVTPSCPYCPYAVLLANMFAFESFKNGGTVYSHVVEAYENPDIADMYGVMSVPAIAVNGSLVFVGVPYEEDFIEYIKAAAQGRIERGDRPEFEGATPI
ncbi:MAG: thioredoxin family protein [Desulfurococcales archaeon]|nr:thioredoxin family protein [Desulfurococcales archaeon]